MCIVLIEGRGRNKDVLCGGIWIMTAWGLRFHCMRVWWVWQDFRERSKPEYHFVFFRISSIVNFFASSDNPMHIAWPCHAWGIFYPASQFKFHMTTYVSWSLSYPGVNFLTSRHASVLFNIIEQWRSCDWVRKQRTEPCVWSLVMHWNRMCMLWLYSTHDSKPCWPIGIMANL
jgi:hypothetical protein